MKERPILFSAPMVRAILAGTKTQTRRVLKPQPPPECGIHYMLGNESWLPKEQRGPLRHHWEAWHGPLFNNRPKRHLCGSHTVRCPFGVPGDRLYVKEATWIWCEKCPNGRTPKGRQKYRYLPVGQHVVYCADHEKPTDRIDGNPSRLWRWKSARFMPRWASRITLEITDVCVQRVQEISSADAQAEGMESCTPYDQFRALWDSINGAKHPWSSDSWVWCVSFKRVEATQ